MRRRMLPRRTPSEEGGPAGSGVFEAAISAAPPGGAVPEKAQTKSFLRIFRGNPPLRMLGQISASALFVRFGRMAGELEAIPCAKDRERDPSDP
jgi:hypothetical protein